MSSASFTTKASAFTTGGTSLTTRGKKSSTNNGCVFNRLDSSRGFRFVFVYYFREKEIRSVMYIQ